MKYLVFIITILFFTNNFLFAQKEELCGKLSKKHAKTFDEAMMNYSQGRRLERKLPDNAEKYYKASMLLLKEITDENDKYAPAYYYLGCINVFKKGNNLSAAEKYFSKSIELCPDGMLDAYFQLGKIYYGLEKYEQAISSLDSYLKKSGNINDSTYLEAKEILEWSKQINDIKSKPVKFNPKVVEGISSPEDEYLVIITPDNENAFYTRKTKVKTVQSWSGGDDYKEMFYVSSRIPDANKSLSERSFDKGKPMPEPFNMNANEGGATVTIDNKELILTICKYEDKKNPNYANCDLYYTKFEYGMWSDLERIDVVNTPDYWESQPSISSDGKDLYFISDRPGGMGGYDIYLSQRDENGNWGTPKNLGKNINSKGNEKSPFIHTDSKTLYFSSDGRPGIGGYDIFYSRLDKNGDWQKPVNIGYPINTTYDDVGFFVSTNGKYGYFGSNNMKEGIGGWDFYSFDLYEEARPEKVLFVKGTIKDEVDNTPIDAKVQLKNLKTREIKEIPVDMETGNYVAAIPFNADFLLTVKKADYVYENAYISQEDSTFDEPKNLDIDLEPVVVGKSYRMNDIYYKSNSAELLSESKKVLDDFIDFLNENPNIKVKIQGHTDNIGSDAFNMTLSEERAKSVFDYLIENGISASRLSYKGFGESKPVDTNDTEAGRAMNRRTEFLITGM
ncbi:MAG: OmpA family protein [Bacteroidales bacterium]|nr:OmpA family protein [Bacteroidales bacterium]